MRIRVKCTCGKDFYSPTMKVRPTVEERKKGKKVECIPLQTQCVFCRNMEKIIKAKFGPPPKEPQPLPEDKRL